MSRWLPFLAFGLGLLSLVPERLSAQYPRGYGGGFGRRGGFGRGGFGDGYRRPEAADPVVTDGPPDGERLVRLIELTDSQRVVYDSLRVRFMDQTKTDRDELQSMRESFRKSREGNSSEKGWDFKAAQKKFEAMAELTKALKKQQEGFDKTLKETLFTKDQWKQYEHWRKEERKFAERRQEGLP